MSIWEIGLQHIRNKENENLQHDSDSTLLFVGAKSSGKSTIISRFLDKNDNTKPTVALEYAFGRQTRGQNIPKLITHVWELGGGTWLQKLIDVVITPDNIRTLTLVVMVDLSEPSSVIQTIDILIKVVNARIDFILEKINDGDATKDYLKEKMNQRMCVTRNNEERQLQEPLLIPVVFVGGKYDKFRKLELKECDIICKTLRFYNHYYGGSLYYFSLHQEVLVNRMRLILRHYAFGSTTSNKTLELSSKNPLSIPIGQDSFQEIGIPTFNPNSTSGSSSKHQGESLVQYWKRAYYSYYEMPDLTKTQVTNPSKNPQFAEKLLDEAKQMKDEELEKYRRISERKMRDLRQQAINDGMLAI